MVVKREGKVDCILLYARPDTAGFMGRQGDHVSVSDLALPGTHDTCAYYGCASSMTDSLPSCNSDCSCYRPCITMPATVDTACTAAT